MGDVASQAEFRANDNVGRNRPVGCPQPPPDDNAVVAEPPPVLANPRIFAVKDRLRVP